jgi:hypothetical protein
MPEAEFTAAVNAQMEGQGGELKLVDGYAPFCKHVFVPNFAALKATSIPITESNEKFLRTKYEARTEKELPVLVRYFSEAELAESGQEVPEAKFLDIILYSREQIIKENKAMDLPVNPATEAWGIVSVKPQMVNYECPMTPITMLRNALGVEEGGSGIALNRDKYNASVAFWKAHASVL